MGGISTEGGMIHDGRTRLSYYLLRMSTISGVRGSQGDSVEVWKPLVRRKMELKSNATVYEGPVLPVAQSRVQWYPTLPLAAHRLIG